MRTFSPRNDYEACCNLILAIIERAVLDGDHEFLAECCAPNVSEQFRSFNYCSTRGYKPRQQTTRDKTRGTT